MKKSTRASRKFCRSFNCNLYNDLYLDEGDIILKVFEKCFTMDKQTIVGIDFQAVKELTNHHADILVNGEFQNIPKYLKSNQYYTKEEYAEI